MSKPLCKTALAAALAAAAMTGGSCAVVAWFTAQFAPPRKVEAQFSPPKGKKVLVFVDDILNPVSHEPIKIELTRRLNQLLVDHKVAAATVSYDRLADLVLATPGFNRLAVTEVGQRLGADIVLYVHVDSFALRDEAAQQLWRGRLQVTVRMVDVRAVTKEEARLWPRDREAGYLVKEIETETTTDPSETYADELTRRLATEMADRVAKLFYEHKAPPDVGWSR